MTFEKRVHIHVVAGVLLGLLGCGDGGEAGPVGAADPMTKGAAGETGQQQLPSASDEASGPFTPAPSGAAAVTMPDMAATEPPAGAAGMEMPMELPGMDMPGMDMPGMNMPGMNMPGMNMPGMNMPGMGDPNAPAPAVGPMDGDPNAPMVSIEGVPCGSPRVGFTSSPPTVKITDRDVVVAYPCAHEGAQVTFFLFLHGTLGDAQKVPFTMNAFPIHNFVDSHNVIVVVPKAIGNQWNNNDGDDTQDLDKPHLYDVVDWVYDTFGEKFDIRSMWASGGSWGAAYLNFSFACDPRFEERLRGVRMVVGTGCPRCSNRLSCIVAEQELEEGGGMPLSDPEKEMKSSSNIDAFAGPHGCDGKMKMPDLGPVRHWTWPNCDPGWVHSYYLGPGNHADPWNDPTSMMHMVDEIKSIE